MSTVLEIERAIEQLPTDEKWNLLHRFQEELWSAWDCEIEDDLKTGHLDILISEARADIANSKTRPLNEVIHNG